MLHTVSDQVHLRDFTCADVDKKRRRFGHRSFDQGGPCDDQVVFARRCRACAMSGRTAIARRIEKEARRDGTIGAGKVLCESFCELLR